ncbi:MAG TPA: LolA-related protein [Stellaceae bacterium]
MTSGSDAPITRRRAVAAALLLWAFPAAARAAGFGVEQLMAELRQVKSATGRFVERKELHMLDKPVEASGTLIYLAPDQMQKITISPSWERLAVRQSTLTIEQEGKSRSFSLGDRPEIGAFVESIRATLAGDLATLERFYTVTLTGDAGDWQLSLVPKERKLQELVKEIRISGSGRSIHTVETEEADGDRSVMRVVEEDIK